MVILSCGDSYTYGVGLLDSSNSYSSLLGQKFGMDLINLGRSGASNYIVHLQALYACEIRPRLTIIASTFVDRVEWLNKAVKLQAHEYHSIQNVDYRHPAPIAQSKVYLTSESLVTIDYHLQQKPVDHLKHEPHLAEIHRYMLLAGDQTIKRDNDAGLLTHAYYRLAREGLPALILANNLVYHRLEQVIPEESLVRIDFHEISQRLPDNLGTYHCSELGHIEIANTIQTHIERYSLL